MASVRREGLFLPALTSPIDGRVEPSAPCRDSHGAVEVQEVDTV